MAKAAVRSNHNPHCRCNILMLPNAQDGPTCSPESAIVAPIPVAREPELRLPPGAIGSGDAAVLGASMPETAVEEQGEAEAGEDHVCLAPQLLHRPAMLEKPQPGAMKCNAEFLLRQRVPRPVGLHRAAHGDRRSPLCGVTKLFLLSRSEQD